MGHTTQFLQGMFAAYMGCEVMNTDDGKHLKMVGVSGSFISVYEPPYPFCESEGDEYEWMYSECKPILTPLSDITDEDAVEVAKICNDNETEKMFILDFSIVKKGYQIGAPPKGILFTREVIDYLRSPYRPDGTPKPIYDCGYMHIPSLITAGLAIKKNKIT